MIPSSDHSAFDAPTYPTKLAAHYVGVPHATLRDWTSPTGLISTRLPNHLSFNNLAEAHILKAMRRRHKLSLQGIRKALLQLSRLRQTPHPLLDERFETFGVSLCIFEENQVINLTRQLQTEIKEVIAVYLNRIERDANGRAFKLYPFIARRDEATEPRHVSISPMVAFGHPVLAGTEITTALVARRFASRDSVTSLALEYSIEERILEDAIRWELLRGKAA